MDHKRAIELLRAAGRRITPERRLILRIIGEHSHLDASEIYALARREDPHISLATVYRTMRLLKEVGLLAELDLGEGRHHYEVREREHYHLICLGCGKVMEIPPVDALRMIGTRYGFTVESVKLEVFGYCPECAPGPRPDAARRLDLRSVPRTDRPSLVAQAVAAAAPGEVLELVIDCPGQPRLAARMVKQIDILELVAAWDEGTVCHALVRRT